MSYTNKSKNKIINDFSTIQDNLTKTAKGILEMKKEYLVILLESLDEKISSNNEKNSEILTNIENLKKNIDNLEKSSKMNYEFLKEAISVLAKHLSVLEKKQTSLVGRLFSTKNDNVEEKIKRLKNQSLKTKNSFNLND